MELSKEAFLDKYAPSEDYIIAYVSTHMGFSEDAHNTILELTAYNREDIANYYAMKKKILLDMSEEEKQSALTFGTMFDRLWRTVGEQHVMMEEWEREQNN